MKGEKLICPYAKPSVAKLLRKRQEVRRPNAAASRPQTVDEDEVIPQPMHLGKLYLHHVPEMNEGMISPLIRSLKVSLLRTRAKSLPFTNTSATLGLLL